MSTKILFAKRNNHPLISHVVLCQLTIDFIPLKLYIEKANTTGMPEKGAAAMRFDKSFTAMLARPYFRFMKVRYAGHIPHP